MNKKLIIKGLIVFGLILVVANYQKLYKTIVPPIPEVVSSYADGTSSSLFNYSTKVFAEVRNIGGDGYVVFEAKVFQGRHEWTKTKSIYLKSYDTKKVSLIFDEVELLAVDPSYNTKVYTLGGRD